MNVLLDVRLLNSRAKPCRCRNGHGVRTWGQDHCGRNRDCRCEGYWQETHEVTPSVWNFLEPQSQGNLKPMSCQDVAEAIDGKSKQWSLEQQFSRPTEEACKRRSIACRPLTSAR